MLTAKQVQLINKYIFAKVVLDMNFKTFIIYMTTLKILVIMLIHLFRPSKLAFFNKIKLLPKF